MEDKSDFIAIVANSAFYDFDCRVRRITKKDIQSLLDGKVLYTTVDFGKRGIALKLEDDEE
jgi:hypothetical protein